jgi:hypothetical protein
MSQQPPNPYKSPISESERVDDRSYMARRAQVLYFCAAAYFLHVLAIWGIACFHEVHTGSELKPCYRFIADTYGATGLLGVAALFAMIPALAYLFLGWFLARSTTSEKSWATTSHVAQYSLGVTLFADVVLGLPVFTTG